MKEYYIEDVSAKMEIRVLKYLLDLCATLLSQ